MFLEVNAIVRLSIAGMLLNSSISYFFVAFFLHLNGSRRDFFNAKPRKYFTKCLYMTDPFVYTFNRTAMGTHVNILKLCAIVHVNNSSLSGACPVMCIMSIPGYTTAETSGGGLFII